MPEKQLCKNIKGIKLMFTGGRYIGAYFGKSLSILG